MKSQSVSGPMGCPQPSFIPLSMYAREAKPSSYIRTAAIRYGTSSMFTMKPERSLVSIGRLPRRSTNPFARVTAAELVSSATTTSTSIITGTGEKKCRPSTRLGSLTAWASSAIGIEDVLEATIAPSETTPSIASMTASLSRSSSGTASAIPVPMKPPPTTATDSISLMPSRLMPVALSRRVALEGELDEPVEQLGVRHPAGLKQRGEHAGGGEARHRVELVEQHMLALDEEVDAGQPAAPAEKEGLDGHLLDALAYPGRDARRHDQLHTARCVLGLVVVPARLAGGQYDLARLGGDGLPVADHRALDLEPAGRCLDDGQRIVFERGLKRIRQLGRASRPDDPDRRAQARRLDEPRQP